MAEYIQCVDCGVKFEEEDRYLKHRAAEHPRAEREDALQGNAQGAAEGVADYAQQGTQQQGAQPQSEQGR